VRSVRIALSSCAAVALAAVPVVVLAPTSAGAATADFTEVGSTSWTVPDGVSCVAFDVFGADGGTYFEPDASQEGAAAATNGAGGASAADSSGGLGGEAEGTIAVLPGQTLQINVGGRGGDSSFSATSGGLGGAGGFNGGGNGGTPTFIGDAENAPGAGGGGASDIRLGGTGLDNRVVVAGGGGGAGGFNDPFGGEGGGESGGDGSSSIGSATAGTGGTQSAGGIGGASGGAPAVVAEDGSAGVGGAGAGGPELNGGGGGGGGGWFGGGGGGGVIPGAGSSGGGGGGSGFIAGNSGDLFSGVGADNGGNGRVSLSYEVGDTSCLAAPLTIKKATTGATARPGQAFTVQVACDSPTIFLGGQNLSSVDLSFAVDDAGVVQPASGYTLGFDEENHCTVTETAAGSQTSETSYACTGSGAQTAIDAASAGAWQGGVGTATAANPDDPCVTSGPQATPIAVDIVTPDQQATVTVTNTLVDPAAAVNVTPRFTG
jgi:hypothetical protein